jgi:hypothetical protein
MGMEKPGRVRRLVFRFLLGLWAISLTWLWVTLAPSSLLIPFGLLSGISNYLASYVIICSLTDGIDVERELRYTFYEARNKSRHWLLRVSSQQTR